MPEDRTILTADASQYFDVMARAGTAANRLAGSGERVGAGFLKGERVIETATRNITTGLLTAGDAGTALAITLEGVARSLKLPLVVGIGAAAGVTAFTIYQREVEKTNTAVKNLREEMRHPLSITMDSSPSDIVTRIEAVDKALKDLKERQDSIFNPQRRVDDLPSHLRDVLFETEDPLQKEVEAGEQRRRDYAIQRANAELRIAESKQRGLSQDKLSQDTEKATLEFEKDRAKLLDELATKGIDKEVFDTRFRALQITRDTAIAQAKITDQLAKQLALDKAIADAESKRQSRLGQQVRSGQEATSFFEDVGSGRFFENLRAEEQRRRMEQHGRNLISEWERDLQEGRIRLGRDIHAALREADRLAARQRPDMSIQELAATDFTNLLELSKYDFSGLQPLSGLTIEIQ